MCAFCVWNVWFFTGRSTRPTCPVGVIVQCNLCVFAQFLSDAVSIYDRCTSVNGKKTMTAVYGTVWSIKTERQASREEEQKYVVNPYGYARVFFFFFYIPTVLGTLLFIVDRTTIARDDSDKRLTSQTSRNVTWHRSVCHVFEQNRPVGKMVVEISPGHRVTQLKRLKHWVSTFGRLTYNGHIGRIIGGKRTWKWAAILDEGRGVNTSVIRHSGWTQ